MGIGDGVNTYSDSMLLNMKKSELIEIIRCLEKNCCTHLETIENQTNYLKKLTGGDNFPSLQEI
ncbi:hypothetical protein [[Clostridium] polysaccharolyticum]|uniref:Uncharacterized protein n=1 Tax=[Clostridium] polysaccharolyticum TaxID=29364 RepID=A0A1H9YJ21_9FIRM|nr:hypothetical protein [[Clostridium] polysaccharolyticum]SES69042.1 hypothetical protein SAMN04487772_10246 [[Clostridium] polysaccharolyticum]